MVRHRLLLAPRRLVIALFCYAVFTVSRLAWLLRARSLAFLLACAGLLGLVLLMSQSQSTAGEKRRA